MTGTYQISYTPEAYRDLEAIYSYIAFTLQKTHCFQSNQTYSDRDFLPTHISRALCCRRLGAMGLYGNAKISVNHYIVYYLVGTVDRLVTVIRIFYGGRDAEHIVNEAYRQADCENPSES